MGSLKRTISIGLVVVLAAIGVAVVMFDGDNSGQLSTMPDVVPTIDQDTLGPTSGQPLSEPSLTSIVSNHGAPRHISRAASVQPAPADIGLPPDTLVYWDGTADDGSRILVADVPLFSVRVTSTGLPYLLLDGIPHLLMLGSEVTALMERFPSVPDSVSMDLEVVRRIRYVKEGRVVREEGPQVLEPTTLDDIFAKHAKAPAKWSP